jgi:hypothetical protein
MRSKWGPIRMCAPPDRLRAALAALFFALLSSCGGGGSVPAAGPIVPVTPRAGLHMGYYWGCAPFMIEQADHVDTWWATGYCNAPGAANDESIAWHLRVAAELQQARGAGIRNIVIMRDMTDLAGARFDLTRLSDGGYFTGWDSITFYPLDEPGSAQGGRKTDAEVTELVTKVKQLALDIPGLAARTRACSTAAAIPSLASRLTIAWVVFDMAAMAARASRAITRRFARSSAPARASG